MRFCPKAKIYVLCMDTYTKQIIDSLKIQSVIAIGISEIENQELLKAKSSRGKAEYCWTLSSYFTWYLMEKNPDIELLTYLDADLLFYSDVQPLFDEIGNASIAIIEHRFSPEFRDREVNGRFCVEWNSFRRDTEGIACLTRWKEQCLDWCFYRLEDGKMGDQKYLDEWPSLYSSCHILQHPGAGIAPWNFSQYVYSQDQSGSIIVEGAPLIFYHFHQFQLLKNGNFNRMSSLYTTRMVEPAAIYEAYEIELLRCLAEIRSLDINFQGGLKSSSSVFLRRLLQSRSPMWAKELARKILRY